VIGLITIGTRQYVRLIVRFGAYSADLTL